MREENDKQDLRVGLDGRLQVSQMNVNYLGLVMVVTKPHSRG